MAGKAEHKILFVINPGSGCNDTNWSQLITTFFAGKDHTIELFHLEETIEASQIKEKINVFKPWQVVAVGGDGTVKLVAGCLLKKPVRLGILPAGSANGLAKELGISTVPEEALAMIEKGASKKIHVTNINDELCIHLSDIGFNAYAMKRFEMQESRGMWGYVKAVFRIFRKVPLMDVEMIIDHKKVDIKAVMIVIANATKYGTGAVINPIGILDDDVFEVIAVKKISIAEIAKMYIEHAAYDWRKTEVFQTSKLTMKCRKKVHFQVDGEYLGMVTKINASILTHALEIVIP